jgi:hypothetical protein
MPIRLPEAAPFSIFNIHYLAVIFSDFDIRKFEIISVVGPFEYFQDIIYCHHTA